MDYFNEKLTKHDPYFIEPMNATKGKIIIDGNAACGLGAVFAGVTVVAWYPITPSTSVVEATIEYLKKFGYSGAQAYSILGTAPVQGHISGVVDVPNACATLWLPTQIFDFDINPSAAGPVKHLDGSVVMPLSRDLG